MISSFIVSLKFPEFVRKHLFSVKISAKIREKWKSKMAKISTILTLSVFFQQPSPMLCLNVSLDHNQQIRKLKVCLSQLF